MVTEFGKFLRKIRIDRTEYLKDMAEKLGVTSSYLSAVENGKRNATDVLVRKICKLYNLSLDEAKNLQYLAAISNQEVQICIKNESTLKKELAVSFARRFSKMNNEQIQKIYEILEKEEM